MLSYGAGQRFKSLLGQPVTEVLNSKWVPFLNFGSDKFMVSREEERLYSSEIAFHSLELLLNKYCMGFGILMSLESDLRSPHYSLIAALSFSIFYKGGIFFLLPMCFSRQCTLSKMGCLPKETICSLGRNFSLLTTSASLRREAKI